MNMNTEVKKHSRTGAILVAAGLFLALAPIGTEVYAQVQPLQIIPLAQGLSTDRRVDLKATGPNDVLQSLLVFQPGADTGWHIHPGPVVVVVKTGTIIEQQSNGCLVTHPAGSVFYEQKNEVHRAYNAGGTVSEVYATFISPSGSQPLIPVGDPHGSCSERENR